MLKILALAAGPYQVNTLIVWCDRTKKAVIFDAPGETDRLVAEGEKLAVNVEYLINTHGHMDHIAENGEVMRRFNVPLLIHEKDRPMLTDPAKNLSLFAGQTIISPDASGTLAEGDSVVIGAESMKVLHVPGHTPGSLVFYSPGMVITGDTLFAGGIGRTDFPGCSEQVLIENIRNKILTLPDETIVYPGHGPTTTVGEERRTNPFVRG